MLVQIEVMVPDIIYVIGHLTNMFVIFDGLILHLSSFNWQSDRRKRIQIYVCHVDCSNVPYQCNEQYTFLDNIHMIA